MTKTESDLIQALRLEMQAAFHLINDSIVELTSEQRSHLAAHAERDKMRVASDKKTEENRVTRRWVVTVVISSLTVMASIAGVTVAVIKLVVAG